MKSLAWTQVKPPIQSALLDLLPVLTSMSHRELSSPMSQGESSASCLSPWTTHTTVPVEDDSGWPIALRKGIRSTKNSHPIFNFLSYHRLSPYFSFISSISPLTIPKYIHEALDHPGWRQATVVEMQALESSGTWELVPLPPGKQTVSCRWVYAIKVRPNGEVDRLKARLVAKGYT